MTSEQARRRKILNRLVDRYTDHAGKVDFHALIATLTVTLQENALLSVIILREDLHDGLLEHCKSCKNCLEKLRQVWAVIDPTFSKF